MQKIRLQIMLSMEDLNVLHRYQVENRLQNESSAVANVFKTHRRLQFIVSELEKKAHEAEKWKKRAEKKAGTSATDIFASDAKNDTDSKVKSGGNMLDIQQQNEVA